MDQGVLLLVFYGNSFIVTTIDNKNIDKPREGKNVVATHR